MIVEFISVLQMYVCNLKSKYLSQVADLIISNIGIDLPVMIGNMLQSHASETKKKKALQRCSSVNLQFYVNQLYDYILI